MRVAAVLFDLGDTLTDLGEGRGSYEARLALRARRVYDVLAERGARLPLREPFCEALARDSEAFYHDALAEQRGIDVFEVMQRFLARHDITAAAALVDAAAEAYCTGGGELPAGLRAGALETLGALQARGLRLGAISNTIQTRRFMEPALARRGLAPFLEVQIFSAECGIAKPHPLIFRMALDALGVAPESAVYVGDRLVADVGGAQGAGMKGVLIEVAHRVEQHAQIVPDARISELPELHGVLARFENEAS